MSRRLRPRRRVLVLALMLLVPTATATAPSACPWHVADGQAPDVVQPRLSAKTRELCFVGFAVLHSGVTRTPLWAAEHLTRDRVNAAEAMERTSTFHAEPRVPPDERAELADYARSGFDRGHMAPSGDMPDERSQQESFTLANIVPQNPDNNRKLWGRIESVVRDLAQTEGELYVVTGPIFQGARLKRLHGRVLVPTHVFKAVHDPERRQAAAYVAPNAPGDTWTVVSIAELRRMTGLDVFPGLPAAMKDTPMALPPPAGPRHPRNEPVR